MRAGTGPDGGDVTAATLDYVTARPRSRAWRLAIGIVAFAAGSGALIANAYGVVMLIRQSDAMTAALALRIAIALMSLLMLTLFGVMLLIRSRFAWHCAVGYFIVTLILPLITAAMVPFAAKNAVQGTLGAKLVLLSYTGPVVEGLIHVLVVALLVHPPVRAVIEQFACSDDAPL